MCIVQECINNLMWIDRIDTEAKIWFYDPAIVYKHMAVMCSNYNTRYCNRYCIAFLLWLAFIMGCKMYVPVSFRIVLIISCGLHR